MGMRDALLNRACEFPAHDIRFRALKKNIRHISFAIKMICIANEKHSKFLSISNKLCLLMVSSNGRIYLEWVIVIESRLVKNLQIRVGNF